MTTSSDSKPPLRLAAAKQPPGFRFHFSKSQSALEFIIVFGALLFFLALSLASLQKAKDAVAQANAASLEFNALQSISSTAYTAHASGRGSRIEVSVYLPKPSQISYDESSQELSLQFQPSTSKAWSWPAPNLEISQSDLGAGRYSAVFSNEERGVVLSFERE